MQSKHVSLARHEIRGYRFPNINLAIEHITHFAVSMHIQNQTLSALCQAAIQTSEQHCEHQFYQYSPSRFSDSICPSIWVGSGHLASKARTRDLNGNVWVRHHCSIRIYQSFGINLPIVGMHWNSQEGMRTNPDYVIIHARTFCAGNLRATTTSKAKSELRPKPPMCEVEQFRKSPKIQAVTVQIGHSHWILSQHYKEAKDSMLHQRAYGEPGSLLLHLCKANVFSFFWNSSTNGDNGHARVIVSQKGEDGKKAK